MNTNNQEKSKILTESKYIILTPAELSNILSTAKNCEIIDFNSDSCFITILGQAKNPISNNGILK